MGGGAPARALQSKLATAANNETFCKPSANDFCVKVALLRRAGRRQEGVSAQPPSSSLDDFGICLQAFAWARSLFGQ